MSEQSANGTARGIAVRMALVAGVALLGLTLAIIGLINQSDQAADQRAKLKEATEVLSALQCTLTSEDKTPQDLAKELDRTGAVRLTSGCQHYVEVLGVSLVYDAANGSVMRK